jgi:hypothetical protein
MSGDGACSSLRPNRLRPNRLAPTPPFAILVPTAPVDRNIKHRLSATNGMTSLEKALRDFAHFATKGLWFVLVHCQICQPWR